MGLIKWLFNKIHKGSGNKCSWTVPSKGLTAGASQPTGMVVVNDIHDPTDQGHYVFVEGKTEVRANFKFSLPAPDELLTQDFGPFTCY